MERDRASSPGRSATSTAPTSTPTRSCPSSSSSGSSARGFGEFLFYDWAKEPGWDLPANPILVAGENFGCGSSREHAPWGLQDYGFQAIVAPSFADIFYSNCTKIGLLPVVLSAEDCRGLARAGDGQVDLAHRRFASPARQVAFEIDHEIRHRLLGGLDDIALTLQQDDAIAAYERERERSGPGDDRAVSGARAERRSGLVASRAMAHHIVTLPGDGIGPEIMAPTLELLEAARRLRVRGAPVRRRLDRRPRRRAHRRGPRRLPARRRGAAGGRRRAEVGHDRPGQAATGAGAARSAQGLGLYANLRPVKPLPALYDASPLRRERIEGTDLLVVRELTGGIYFGEKTRTETSASDVCSYTTEEIERIARTAFGRGAASRRCRAWTRPTCWRPRGCGARS